MNNFPYSCDNKRYHTLNFHNKTVYGGKIYKAVIDAGLTCPNIDGTKGFGGCIYCDGGSGYFTGAFSSENLRDSITSQLGAECTRIKEKTPNAKIVAYFQSHTNTYAPVSKLKSMFDAALECKDICGISIGTRADCLPDDVLFLLSEMNKSIPLSVELGLQTIHDDTAKIINRCHTYEEFLVGYNSLRQLGIRTCIHIINGLPGETIPMMLETAKETGRLCPDGLKIHLLHIIKGTALEKMLYEGKVTPMEKEEYINLVVNQLEYIPPETVIERITGDGDKKKLIAPMWSADKISVLGGIDKKQVVLDSWQGKKYISYPNY